MALPCKLLLPEGEAMATMKQISDVSGGNPQFTQGAGKIPAALLRRFELIFNVIFGVACDIKEVSFVD